MLPHASSPFGDLVVAAYDLAARRATSPSEVTRLAIQSLESAMKRIQHGVRITTKATSHLAPAR